jgi:RNA polymerase sigma-70 factor (ECF subfamily)
MESFSDMKLVERSQGNDSSAFENLVTRHYMTVYRAAYRWCGVKEDAEDITQDVFIKLARKLKTFAGKSSFKTWLYRITVNTAKDFGRKRSTRRTYMNAWSRETGETLTNPGENVDLIAGELYAAIARLPSQQKAAALLVWAEGLTHREASLVLECSESTVSTHIFQAREKLKKLFIEKQ